MRIFEQGDLFDLDTKSELIFIQDLKKGDLVETSIGTDVVEFVKVTDLHGNATQTCSIFGATLLPNHPFVYNGIWTSPQSVVDKAVKKIKGIVVVVLRNGNHFMVDGLTCMTYNFYDFPQQQEECSSPKDGSVISLKLCGSPRLSRSS